MKRPNQSKIMGYSQCVMYMEFENGVDWNFFGVQEGNNAPTTSGHGDITFYGTMGTLVNSKFEPPIIFLKDKPSIVLEKGIVGVDDGVRYPPTWDITMKKFIECYHNGKEHPTCVRDVYKTMEILFGAIKSFETGKVYEIPTQYPF